MVPTCPNPHEYLAFQATLWYRAAELSFSGHGAVVERLPARGRPIYVSTMGVSSRDGRTPPFVAPYKSGCRVRVHVQPRAKTTAWAGLHGDRLKLRVTAPPVDGAANDACIRAVAERLGVPRSSVALVAGKTGRDKDFAVAQVLPETAAAAFADQR